MSVVTIITLLSIHWLSDFVFQTGEQAANKSSSNWWLTGHCFYYIFSFSILFLMYCIINHPDSEVDYWKFVGITFVCHWITDYFTSRVVKEKFKREEYYTTLPNTGAFSVIGFDQLLHYIQIFITYNYLFS
jgi:hypothetical protein